MMKRTSYCCLGNTWTFFQSCPILVRTALENTIYLKYIIKHKDKRLWKKWELYSGINILKRVSDEKKEECLSLIEKELWEEGITLKGKLGDNSWLEDVFPGMKSVSIRRIFEELGDLELYEDYAELSNYVHGQNLYIKNSPFTFYNGIIHKIEILTRCLLDAAEIFVQDFPKYEEIYICIYEKRMEVCEQIVQEGWVKIKIKLEEIVQAMETADVETEHYLNKDTGEILSLSEYFDPEEKTALGEELEENWMKYIKIPGQCEIDQYRMMKEFVSELPTGPARQQLSHAICGKGAFRRFKDAVCGLRLAEKWYNFRDTKYMAMAKAWCEENRIEYEE